MSTDIPQALASSAPPPHRRRTDPDNTWRPEDDDDSLEATAKRARLALANDVAHTVAISGLTAAILPLTSAVSGLTRGLKWAGAIAGGVFVVWGATSAKDCLGRVRVDPPALQAPAAPR